MDVDIDNFHQIRAQIENSKLIENSKCISYDLQFTGVKFSNNERERSQDMPFDRYRKMSFVVAKYNIIQLGITFFIHQKQTGKVIAHPYNFYLFPRENALRDPIVSLQGNTVQFNSNQGMDWNRWIKKGIPYIKISEIEQLEKKKGFLKSYSQLLQTADQDVRKTVKQIIKQGYKRSSIEKSQNMTISRSSMQFVKKIIERFIEQTQDAKFNVNFSYEANNNSLDKVKIKVEYLSPQQKLIIAKKSQEKVIGFTLLFQKIWNSGKIFVGHNCLFDLLYLYESLVGSLPPSYQSFKQELRKNNRRFYDTKVISSLYSQSNSSISGGTSLESIYAYLIKQEKELVSQLRISLANGFQSYDLNNPALHQAGFDSYLTGWIFYAFMNKFPKFESLQGKINLFRSYFQMNIGSGDNINPQNTVFVIIVAPQNKYMPKQQIIQKKKDLNNKLKNQFKKVDILQNLQIHESLKQIYIEIRFNCPNKDKIVSQIIGLMQDQKIPNIMTLAQFMKSKIKMQSNLKQDSKQRFDD